MGKNSVVVAAKASANGLAVTKARAGQIVKPVLPAGENQRRVGVLTLPVDLRWLNAKLLKVKQPHVRKPPLKELIGKEK